MIDLEKIVKTDSLENEKTSIVKSVSYNNKYPLITLEPREFEVLGFEIFNRCFVEKYNKVFLMQGVGERGRDITLFRDYGSLNGVVQCKRLTGNFSLTDAFEEIIKFFLHCSIDEKITPDLDDFKFFFMLSNGETEKLQQFLADKYSWYDEIDLELLVEKLKVKYKKLKDIKYKEVELYLLLCLERTVVESINGSQIQNILKTNSSLSSIFFSQTTVVNDLYLNSFIEKVLKAESSTGTRKNEPLVETIQSYSLRSYKKYSYSRTILFGDVQKNMRDIYYPLNLIQKNKMNIEELRSIKIDSYPSQIINRYERVAIIDNGGMGKSTLVRKLFLSCLEEGESIPILIELRKIKEDSDLIELIEKELESLTKNINRSELFDALDLGCFTFFFDGYDEISPELVTKVTGDIQGFIEKTSKNKFILTSRPDKKLLTFSTFQNFTIRKLSKDEACELIILLGRGDEQSKSLVSILKSNKHDVDEFLGNPLLVSLLFKKFKYKANIPLKRHEFFKEVYDALYESHDLTKEGAYERPKKSKLTSSDFSKVLMGIAIESVKLGKVSYSRLELEKIIKEVKVNLDYITIVISDIITDLDKNVQIFIKEGNEYRWAHKSFQDYFAAEYICRTEKFKCTRIIQQMLRSKRVESYKGILQLCYDIDYEIFRTEVLYPFGKELIKHHIQLTNKTFKGIDINIAETLSSLVFFKSFVFLFDENSHQKFNDDKNISKLFEYVKVNSGVNIRTIMNPGKNYLVCSTTNPKNEMLADILIDKNSSLIKPIRSLYPKKLSKNKIDEKIKKNGIYVFEKGNISTEIIKYNREFIDIFFFERIFLIKEFIALISTVDSLLKNEREKEENGGF